MRCQVFLLWLAVCCAACLACYGTITGSQAQVDRAQADELARAFASTDCQTDTDVQRIVSNSAASKRAVLFVHVGWAVMEPQQHRFVEFALAYARKYSDSGVLFYYVDCTPVTDGYAPLVELEGWKELQDAASTSLIHGWGEVVWMESGRVLRVERILAFESAADLIRTTRETFR